MKPVYFLICLFSLLFAPLQSFAQNTTQQVQPPTQLQSAQTEQLSEAEKKLFDTIKKMNDSLAGVPEFQLNLKNEISIKSTTGKAPADRKIELRLHSQRGQTGAHIQLQWLQLGGDKPAFVVDWKKGAAGIGVLQRAFLPEKLISIAYSADLRSDLRQCQFTADNLKASHADFLLQPDLLQHVQSLVVHVVDMSKPDELPHFQLEFSDGRAVEVWFGRVNDIVLPSKLESHEVTLIGTDQKIDTVTTGTFEWKFGDKIGEWFNLSNETELRKVNDLRNAMLGKDSSDIAGKAIPDVPVTNLDGVEYSVARLFGKSDKPVLLYFWATWAAPSVRELGGVQEFATELSKSGIQIHPVNVGETVEQVERFLDSKNIPFQVWRDSEGQLVEKMGIGKLPAVVILYQGKVSLIREGIGPKNRDQVRKDLMGLISK